MKAGRVLSSSEMLDLEGMWRLFGLLGPGAGFETSSLRRATALARARRPFGLLDDDACLDGMSARDSLMAMWVYVICFWWRIFGFKL